MKSLVQISAGRAWSPELFWLSSVYPVFTEGLLCASSLVGLPGPAVIGWTSWPRPCLWEVTH